MNKQQKINWIVQTMRYELRLWNDEEALNFIRWARTWKPATIDSWVKITEGKKKEAGI